MGSGIADYAACKILPACGEAMEVLSKIPDLLISFIKEQAPKVLDWYKSLPPKGKAGAFSALIFF